MIQSQLKLRLSTSQSILLDDWLFILTGVWNWAVRKIENDSKGNIYYTEDVFRNILNGHSKRIGVPSHVMQGVLSLAHASWNQRFKNIKGKPRLKGARNKLNSIPFPDPIYSPKENNIRLPIIGSLRFHKQDIPTGKIKCGRIVKRASGWYLCLFIDADRQSIKRESDGVIGIDPGFKDLITTSDGNRTDHPKELQKTESRLAQAQRGINRKLVARLHERIANKRKDRNHKLSLRLVQQNIVICFSKDNIKGMAARFGKSVTSSGHAQLRSMLEYKSSAGGTQYIEVASKNSTRTCSACGAITGPKGLSGLAVRKWECMACGTPHDRDQNAAINTLIAGVGTTLERRFFPSGIPLGIPNGRFIEGDGALLDASESDIKKHEERLAHILGQDAGEGGGA